MDTTQSPTDAPKPTIQQIGTDDVYDALKLGWQDFRAEPKFGLFFGGVYAVAGLFIFLQLFVLGQSLWIFPLAFAFPLIGPFAAIGLYEVSRRREQGLPQNWSEILEVVRNQRHGQLPSMAFVVLFVFMAWIWLAHLIFALFMGRFGTAIYSDIGSVLTSVNGISMLIFGTLIGGAIALVLFSITAVSLPLLLEREVDFVTAMITSVSVVRENTVPMLHWAWIVVAVLVVGMIPLFLGLVVALPVLGHGTWHLYRKTIK